MLLKEILFGRYAVWAAICGLTVLSALGILLSSHMIWPTVVLGFFAILGFWSLDRYLIRQSALA